MSDEVYTYIMRIIVTVAFLNFAFLLSLIFVAEYISGDTVLSGSIAPSKDIQSNIMLTENKKVTIVFKTNDGTSDSESLNISLVDPHNRDFFWTKIFTASHDPRTTTSTFFSFTPEASGKYHIQISNADFTTEVKVISGMIIPYEQPLYLPSIIISFIVLLAGGSIKGVNKSLKNFSLSDALNVVISLCLSLFIVYEVMYM